MNILVLNGSPRPRGNTAAMTAAFAEGARGAGHRVDIINVCQKKIAGCLACDHCREKGERRCIQQDDMQEVYPLLDAAEMLVLASPVYYHGFSGQLQCAINRIYALDKPKKLKKAALILSSESDGVYDGAIYEYQNSFIGYLELEDMGIFTAFEEENKLAEKLLLLRDFGASLKDTENKKEEQMQYKDFKDGVRLSRLGMGNMRLPVIDGRDDRIDFAAAKAIIDRCMERGVNYYDTAYIYHGGRSEEFLGRALAQYPRESYHIADKFNIQADPDYRAQFAAQLENLGLDYIDFYLLHGIQDDFLDEILQSGCIDYFDEMRKQGKIRFLGFSYHGSPEKLPGLLEVYPWDFVQIQLNYYDWYFGEARELYETITSAGIPVMVMEPVHGGLLANLTEEAASILKSAAPQRSLASWAMRWVMGLENVQVVLSGMSEPAQLEDNAATFAEALPLSEEDEERIKKAAQIQHAAVAVACTGCRYCCADCPAGLDIPELLKSYNDGRLNGSWRLTNLLVLPAEAQPGACIGCGSCTRHCPQGFDVPQYMAEMRDLLSSMAY